MSHDPGCRCCGETLLAPLVKWERPAAKTPGGPAAFAADTAFAADSVGSDLVFCPSCALVQRLATAANLAADGRTEHALPSEAAGWSSRQLVSQVIATQKLRPTSLVMQIGSCEGKLLADYQAAGVPVLGIEPAVRLAELARLEHGVPTLCRHFDKYLAASLTACGEPADVVHLHHVLPLVADLNLVIAGLPIVLKDTGVAVIELAYVKHLIDRGDLWSPHRREQSYFSLTSLERLLSRHGLVIHDVEHLAEGGSLRLFAGKQGATSSRVAALLVEEQAWGVDRPATYRPRRHAKVA